MDIWKELRQLRLLPKPEETLHGYENIYLIRKSTDKEGPMYKNETMCIHNH